MSLYKKIISLSFCLIFVFCSFAVVIPQDTEARTLTQVEADIRECEALLASLQNEKAALSGQIKELDKAANLTAEQLNVYIQEIEYLETEVELTEETIQAFVMKLSEIEVSILIEEENLLYYQQLYASIVRYSFMQGDISIFELLFESESFSDFLTRVDNINYFLKYTDSVMESITSTKNDLEIIKANHQTAKSKLDEYKSDLEEKISALDVKRSEADSKASSLGTSLSKVQGDYISTSSLIEQTKSKITALRKERQEILDADKNFIWPVKTTNYYVSSVYGWRRNPFDSSQMQFHNGLDIACAHGVPIIASKGGTVTRSEHAAGWGNVVVVYHGNGISTLYAHASSRVARVGDTVKQGDVIAYVGTTGSSTGNHLHISFIINGAYEDPAKYLPKGYF